MPTLRIQIRDDVWPTVLAALAAGFEVPDGGPSREWVERIAAGIFAEQVKALMEPPPVPSQPPRRRIRPSQVRTT